MPFYAAGSHDDGPPKPYRPPAAQPRASPSLCTLPAQPVACVFSRVSTEQLQAGVDALVGMTLLHLQRLDVQAIGRPFARLLAIEAHTVDVEAGWLLAAPVQPSGVLQARSLPAGGAAALGHDGGLNNIGDSLRALEAWVASIGRKAGGPPWVVIAATADVEIDPAQGRADVFLPLLEPDAAIDKC